MPTENGRIREQRGVEQRLRMRRELATNPATSTRPSTNAPRTRGLAQPHSLPCTIASVRALRPAASSSGAADVGQPSPAWRAALDERAPDRVIASDADRQVDQERQPPAPELDQGAADRRAEAGGERGRRAPQADGVAAAVLGERLDHDGERGRDQQCGTERLEDPGGDQHLQGPGRAQATEARVKTTCRARTSGGVRAGR